MPGTSIVLTVAKAAFPPSCAPSKGSAVAEGENAAKESSWRVARPSRQHWAPHFFRVMGTLPRRNGIVVNPRHRFWLGVGLYGSAGKGVAGATCNNLFVPPFREFFWKPGFGLTWCITEMPLLSARRPTLES
ncbi:hypothetical protein MTO96_010411 [Rhipicephalus appendiculatus]